MPATDVKSFIDAKVEYSTNGTAWTDISEYCDGVSVSGGDRMTGEAYRFQNDYALTGIGPRQPVEVTINFAYTEGASEPYQAARTAYEAHSQFQFRWWPYGGEVTEFGFYTDTDSRITSEPLPVGTADSADPTFVEVTVRSARTIQTTAT